MSLLSLDVAVSAVSGLEQQARSRDVGWWTRLRILCWNSSEAEIARMLRQDLLGQAMNPLYHTWGLSTQPFRVAADGAAYPLVEFLTWYDSSAEEMWSRARAANRWETHRALLSRLRAALKARSQRLAVLSLHQRDGLPPVAVCAIAAFLLSEGDAKDILRQFSPMRKSRRLTNQSIKEREGVQQKQSEMEERKTLKAAPPRKKAPWPRPEKRARKPVQPNAVRI